MKSSRYIPTDEFAGASQTTVELPDFWRDDGTLIPRQSLEWRNRLRQHNRELATKGAAHLAQLEASE